MDLSQSPQNMFQQREGIVLASHPALTTGISLTNQVSQASTIGTSGNNANVDSFSISNLVNGLRKQQQDSKNSENATISGNLSPKGRRDSYVTRSTSLTSESSKNCN